MFKSSTIRSGGDAKTVKGNALGLYETAIMYLAPADMARPGRTLCSMAVLAGCIAGCLNTAGRGAFSNVQQARVNKTLRYLDHREAFMSQLVHDLEAFERYCARKGVKPAVRLNGTSDIQWEVGHAVERLSGAFASVFEAFPNIQFYDYTKVYKRAYRTLPANYALTLSFSGASPEYARKVQEAAAETGTNLAVVYRTKAARDFLSEGPGWRGWTVIDGDETDMRFTDPKGVVVGLYAKGRAGKADTSGFVFDC